MTSSSNASTDNKLHTVTSDVLVNQSKNHLTLVAYIQRKNWWHVTPRDPDAYTKRGKFYSSTFGEAEFYGRPGEPERVRISRPLVGDESFIEHTLFGERVSLHLESETCGLSTIEKRLELDALMKRAALKLGFDSIVLMSKSGFSRYCEEGRIPRSIELNLLF